MSKQDRTFLVNSATSCEQMVEQVRRLFREHRYVEFSWRAGWQRTDQQRKAIEVYCRELAKALDEAGLDQRQVLAQMREGVEIPWNQSRVKDVLWREVQKAMLNKVSTTGLKRTEVSKVYETLNRWTAQTLGISVPFPHVEREETA